MELQWLTINARGNINVGMYKLLLKKEQFNYFYIIHSIQKNNTLRIKNFEEKDNGEYTCSLPSPKGNVEDTAQVTLSRPLTVEIQEGKEIVFLENDILDLNCLVQSKDPVQITWSIHGKTLKRESNSK